MHGNFDTVKKKIFSSDVTGLKGRMIGRMTRMTMKNQALPLSFAFHAEAEHDLTGKKEVILKRNI